MSVPLGKVLAKLRLEKKASQRETAEALSVSQALLSHYENGLREPGLAFLGRAADFFACSTDYLLGRTLDRQGISLVLDEKEAESGKTRRGRLLANSFAFLTKVLKESDDAALSADAGDYLTLTLCRLFRRLTQNAPHETTTLDLSPELLDAASEALLSSLSFSLSARLQGHPTPPASRCGALAERFPVLWESMLTLLKEADDRVARFVGAGK